MSIPEASDTKLLSESWQKRRPFRSAVESMFLTLYGGGTGCVSSHESDKRVASSPPQAFGFLFPSFRCCCAVGGRSSNVVSNMPSGQKSAHMMYHMSSNMVCNTRWYMGIGRHGMSQQATGKET